jgi:Uma2 family endonuclease
MIGEAPSMTTASQHITAEELLAMPPDQPCELIAGEIVMMTPAGYEHGKIAGTICFLLRSHTAKNALGTVVSAEAGFVISRNPDTVRAPDVAFVRRDRQPESPEGFFPGAPDLAVEVVSPTDRLASVKEKAQAWLAAGTPLVWVVWPDTRSVVVHRSGQSPRILHEKDAITGEEVLPGFECAVAEFFSD